MLSKIIFPYKKRPCLWRGVWSSDFFTASLHAPSIDGIVGTNADDGCELMHRGNSSTVIHTVKNRHILLYTEPKKAILPAFRSRCTTHLALRNTALQHMEAIMSAYDLVGRPEFYGILRVAQEMQAASLPQYMIERSISRLVGAKVHSMAERAEHDCAHLLPHTPFDGLKGDPHRN